MAVPSFHDYPNAVPLVDTGREPASRAVTIIVARRGAFRVDGAERAAFAVGPRSTPITVGYVGRPDCREVRLPPWMGRALFDVAGCDLANGVVDLSDMPPTPFRDALLGGKSDLLGIARTAFADWSAGRGRGDARLAAAVWVMVERDPTADAEEIADKLGIGTRRLRQAMRAEAGLSLSTLRRLVRHEWATTCLRDGAMSLAEVALAAGYADQSHMTREATALAGLPPARLRAAMVGGP